MSSVYKFLLVLALVFTIYFIITQVVPFLQGKQCLQLQRKIDRYGQETLLHCVRWA
jgi:hypothetical protein